MFEKFWDLYKSTVDPKRLTESELREEAQKIRATKMAKCENLIKNEQDPAKKAVMEKRLSLGILDFSDI